MQMGMGVFRWYSLQLPGGLLPSVTITGGEGSVTISGMPWLSDPAVTGAEGVVTIAALPQISDIRVA